MLTIKNLVRFYLLTNYFFLQTTPSVFSQDAAEKVSAKMEAIAPLSVPAANRYEMLEAAAARLGNDSVLRHGQVGIAIVDVLTGETLASFNPTMSLIPASNMKIVTTAAGLAILGADFQFRTDLQLDGEIRDSILYGNVFIKGYGDPTLASPLMDSVPRLAAVLDSFSNEIKKLGIKKVKGRIVGDGTAFESATAVPTWLWEDLGNYYGAGPSGLTFHENFYDLALRQTLYIDSSPSVSSIIPQVPDFQLINELKTIKGGGDDAYIYAVPYGKTGVLRGTIPAGNGGQFTISGALPDPPLFAAWHLQKTLREKGIDVTDSATTQLALQQAATPTTSRRTFFTWRSPKLSDIIIHTNLESVNLYCEAIVRTVAFQKTGIGTNDKGIEEIIKFWQSKGINTEGLFMQDGSGLSPRNGITAAQLAAMLRVVAIDNQWFTPFFNSLPQPAKSGTLKNMFKNNPSVQARLRAKSGTITRVKSYSGYVTTTDGRLLAFSAMCNNFTCSQTVVRRKLEQFMAEICTY